MRDAQIPPMQIWFHRWAMVTVCAAFVLLFLGSLVTTFKVGMVDSVWPTTPWHLFLISWDEPSPGYLIEHGHRLAAYIVGFSMIGLAVGLALYEPRAWVRRLGWLTLCGVGLQAILGGMRVKLNALMGTDLAMFHGCFAQIVFGLLAALTVVTSPRWVHGTSRQADGHSTELKRWTVITTGLLYVQIVLGAVLRHVNSPLGQRGHLLVAFVAVAAVVWLVKLALDDPERAIVVPALVLAGLTALQVLLGVEAWLLRFGDGLNAEARVTIGQAALRTAHVLTGFCILAMSVVATLRSRRLLAEIHPEQVTAHRLEGAL